LENFYTELYDEVFENIVSERFLTKYNFDRDFIIGNLYKVNLVVKLRDMIMKNDYSSLVLFEVLEGFLNELTPYGIPENFIDYIYQYTLGKAFPDARSAEIVNDYEVAAEAYLIFLRILSKYQKKSKDGTWQSLYPIEFLSKNEIESLEDSEEYLKFMKGFNDDYIYELLKLNQEYVGYSTLDHICGVNHIAMMIGRQLKSVGLPIDMGRVSGSAIGHDVGKFGCKGEELKRVAYFHYYYTGQWFLKHDITYIRNVAINHSTWDLELDNLPIESLILIYSDFRVKAPKDRSSGVRMKYYSLDEAFDVILSKLDNVDDKKEKRYRRVYAKLKDFEKYLISMGLNLDPFKRIKKNIKVSRKHYSLMYGDEVINGYKFEAKKHNIKLLHLLRNESSLNAILENAREQESSFGLRGYLQIIEEYSTYLTQKQKLITIDFLHEKILHPEEDIRHTAAHIIGLLIANFDEELRKEIPESAVVYPAEITGTELLEVQIRKFLEPDIKIISRHKIWLGFAFKSMARSLFEHCKKHNSRKFTELFLRYVFDHGSRSTLYLLEAIKTLPFGVLKEHKKEIFDYLFEKMEEQDDDIRLSAFETFHNLITHMPLEKAEIEFKERFSEVISNISSIPSENFIIYTILRTLRAEHEKFAKYEKEIDFEESIVSELYLSNLKTATTAITKKLQVKLLLKNTLDYNRHNAFYTAMHYCNLLKVSAYHKVRNCAGESLIELVPMLSFEQKNDIVIELLRALEIEGYQYANYIPEYLGRVLINLKPKEFDEIIDDFTEKVKKGSPQITSLILRSIGVSIENYGDYGFKDLEDKKDYDNRLVKMLGVLLNGFVNYDTMIAHTSFTVIGNRLFGSSVLSLDEKGRIFKTISKKVLSLVSNIDERLQILFINNASNLNHIYKFISDYNFYRKKELSLEAVDKVAFFPGSFDPFSLSHKEIAKQIRNLGFEVFLAVDEFSWSKRTQPNLIRRDILKMSVADELDIYNFPRDISVNIANNSDFDKLTDCFKGKEVYMVVGSDVLVNASAYKKDVDESAILRFPHVVFERKSSHSGDDFNKMTDIISKLHRDTVRLVLDSKFEDISSTQIRNYIDENRDISELIDPLAQKYILEKNLYKREPMYKEILTTKSINVEVHSQVTNDILEEIVSVLDRDFIDTYNSFKSISKDLELKMLILRNINKNREIIGFSMFHWLRSANIFKEFDDKIIAEYVRENSVGRILVMDGIFINKDSAFPDVEQMILTETLAHCLAKDYSYCIFNNKIYNQNSDKVKEVFLSQGFLNVKGEDDKEVYVVNMSSPCTLTLDVKSMIKEPFRNSPEVSDVINRTRKKLQEALVNLYPGNLTITFGRTMLYENLIKKICDENRMPTRPIVPKTSGEYMCVPFGALFNRWRLPNTITKAFHTERYFNPNLKGYEIKAYPYYLDIENQVKMIKSYNRSVLLVDDLLHKGYRVRAIDPLFKKENIEIRKIFVGILSGRGKALMESQGRKVDSAYFLPRLKVWFNESHLYPFIGGDTLWRGDKALKTLIPSINLIMPYTSASYIRGASRKDVYNLSLVSLENSYEIMRTLEDVYQEVNSKSLTLSRLGEVIGSPRYPDIGKNTYYDLNKKPSQYILNDIERLKRLELMARTGRKYE
jgi:nicotinic acid mononucleotide adenylyltransferase